MAIIFDFVVMVVYFTASVTGKKHYLENYHKIIKALQAKKCKVISDHIINTSVYAIHSQKRHERLSFHDKLDKWLKKCDFVVAETSFPSISVGYEISLALYYNKPTLVLYSEGKCPSLLADHREERLVCEKYTDNDLDDTISDFISYAQGSSDTRFTFFIPRNMATFLDEVSRKEKVPKSVYLRQLIEKEIKKK